MKQGNGSPVGFRAVLFLSSILAVPILLTLASSRSGNGAVLGMWSPALALMIGAAALCMLLFLLAAIGVFRLLEKAIVLCRRLPEMTGPLLTLFPPVAVVLFWFLFSIPLLVKPLFTLPLILLSAVPGILVILSRTGRERTRVLGGAVVMAGSLLVAVAAGEIVLRSVMPDQIFNPRFGLRPYSRTEMRVDLPGIAPGGILTTNMWGFRGEDPPEDWDRWFTIVTIGGSTTANYYLDDSLTWSFLMQEELRKVDPEVWVGNAGIPRHSSDTHLLLLREVMSEIRPDMAVFLVGVNDMGPFLRPGAPDGRLPDSGLRQWMFSNSSILQLLYKAKVVYIDRAPVVTTTSDPPFIEVPMTEAERPLPEDLHQLLEDPDFYRKRINRLIDECDSLGIVPVFLTQPLLYEDTPHWRSVRETAAFFQGTDIPVSAATFARMVETLNEDLVKVCTERGVAVLDLAGCIPHSRDYFYDAMHFTEAGADLVGRTVAGYLTAYCIEEGLLSPDD